MQRTLRPFMVVFASLALAFLGTQLFQPRGLRSAHLDTPEVRRLRAHFDSVHVELASASSTELDPSQRAWRSQLIGWLEEYRNAGEFPQNDKFPGRRVPFFRDSRGVLCAVGYLAARSGRTDIVDCIASSRNNAYIAELAGDTALTHWIQAVGLTAEEASRIQPAYEGEPGYLDDGSISKQQAFLSAATGGAALVSSGLNVFAPTKASGWLGLVSGASLAVVGLSELDSYGDTETLAKVDLVVGIAAMSLSVLGLTSGGSEYTEPAVHDSQPTQGFQMILEPAILRASGSKGFGLNLRAQF